MSREKAEPAQLGKLGDMSSILLPTSTSITTLTGMVVDEVHLFVPAGDTLPAELALTLSCTPSL